MPIGPLQHAAGFVLAGGQSSRMGRNKAHLQIGTETFLERAVRILREVCPEVAIAGGDPTLSRYAKIIPDREANQGPLSGLVSALEQTQAEWNLFLPVDVPLIPVNALRTLLSVAGGLEAAVIAESAGQPHPLCAVYSRRALPALRAALDAGQYRVRAAIQAAGLVKYVPFEQTAWFANANTPEDFLRIQHAHLHPKGYEIINHGD